ncbi:hypothetical protein SRS16CHR_04289 [Variovorax sp. SRS16]|uniref:hypothetical protein n=1 Tax=Variovorax sp. SRS16 TaxID=282217 RepID=UPI001318790F|nr:hypothetical protein [Variovorax sp. SRS16]VTU28553.1 hypothetical protein SRS16CHR_04289 [Variovorax sp. SRS16]
MTTENKSGASVPETRPRIWVEPTTPEQIDTLEARYEAQRKPAGCSWDPDAPPGVGGYRQLRLTSRTHRCNKCGNVQEPAQFNKSRDRCVTCQTLDNRAMLTSNGHPSAAGYAGVTLAHSWAPREDDSGPFDPAGRYVRFWNDMGQRPGPGWSIDRIALSADALSVAVLGGLARARCLPPAPHRSAT